MKKIIPVALLILCACKQPADTATPTSAPSAPPASAPSARPASARAPATAPAAAPIVLHARDVTIHGNTVRYEPEPHKNTIGYWSDVTDWVSWDFDLAAPGTYAVEVLQGCGAGAGGSEVEIAAGNSGGDADGDAEAAEQRLSFTVEDTGHFQNFVAREVGSFTFAQPGRYTLSVKPKTKPGVAVMDLRQVTLKPTPPRDSRLPYVLFRNPSSHATEQSMTRIALFAAVAAVALVAGVGLFVAWQAPAAHANAAAAAEDAQPKPIKALLVLGGCCHDYKTQQKLITEGISARADVQWTIAYDPDTGTKHLNPVYEKDDWYKGFDVIVHDECTSDVKDPAIIERILKPHREGLPAVHLHCSMHSYRSEGWPDKDIPWFQFTGIATTGHGPQLPIAVSYVDASNPITKGLENWTTINEELYNNVRKPLATATVLATGKQANEQAVVVWTNLYGEKKTKVFGTTLGHNNDTVGDPRYLDLITRGLLWSLDKLDDKHLKKVAAAAARKKEAPAGALAAATDECGCEGDEVVQSAATASR